MSHQRRGAIIVATIAVLIVIDLIVVTVVISGGRDADLSVRRLETVQAYYAAEAGLQIAMREAVLDSDEDGDCQIGAVSYDGVDANDPSIGGGQFLVTASTSGSQITLQSYGRAGDARRQISMTFQLVDHQIVFDRATPTMVGDSATHTFDHEIGGDANRLLVVCIGVEGNSSQIDITSVQYDGVDMSEAVTHSVGSSLLMNVEIWYMLEADLPAAGTHQVFIDHSGITDIMACAISVSGAAQQGPEATAVADDGEAGDSNIQASITTLTDGAWVFECVGSGNAISGFTADTGQQERFDEEGSSARVAGSTEEVATAGLENQQWSASGSNRLSYVLAAFAPK
jgi:hypothetical protein